MSIFPELAELPAWLGFEPSPEWRTAKRNVLLSLEPQAYCELYGRDAERVAWEHYNQVADAIVSARPKSERATANIGRRVARALIWHASGNYHKYQRGLMKAIEHAIKVEIFDIATYLNAQLDTNFARGIEAEFNGRLKHAIDIYQWHEHDHTSNSGDLLTQARLCYARASCWHKLQAAEDVHHAGRCQGKRDLNLTQAEACYVNARMLGDTTHEHAFKVAGGGVLIAAAPDMPPRLGLGAAIARFRADIKRAGESNVAV